MGQRNMLYTGPILETEPAHLQPDQCVVPYARTPNFPQPNNNHTILNRTTFNPQHLPENHTPLPYTITQYNNTDHHGPTNNIFPVAINHGLQEQLSFSSNHGSFEFNSAFKRKNFQYFYPAPGSGSSVVIPMNTEGTVMDGVPFMEPSVVHRSVRNRGLGAIGVEPVWAHNGAHLVHGNYGAQPVQAVPNPWLDQQFCSNGSDAGGFSWNHAPGIPYLQGCISGGGIEAANMGLHGYQVTPNNRNSPTFVHNLHHPPPPPMPPMQGHNMDFHSQLASTSRRILANSATSYTPFQNGIEPGSRFVGPMPPTGLWVYRPHRREMMVESTARHRGFPHLRVLPEDGVAILDISGYHEVGHSVDHHRDMRLDIDHMSYEELLALGEQIGSVGSGLSDDFIVKHLKTRVFASSKFSADPEEELSVDQEFNSCVICQNNYDDQEQIGVLDCGHEYHVECVKKWLTLKNTCPVCKSTGLAGQAKES